MPQLQLDLLIVRLSDVRLWENAGRGDGRFARRRRLAATRSVVTLADGGHPRLQPVARRLAHGPDVKLNEYAIPSQSQGSPEGFVYTWEDRGPGPGRHLLVLARRPGCERHADVARSGERDLQRAECGRDGGLRRRVRRGPGAGRAGRASCAGAGGLGLRKNGGNDRIEQRMGRMNRIVRGWRCGTIHPAFRVRELIRPGALFWPALPRSRYFGILGLMPGNLISCEPQRGS